MYRFALPEGADYGFVISADREGEADISAELVSDPDTYFWSIRLELPDFPSSAALAAQLVYLATQLLGHPSRIIQRRGFLLYSFSSEAMIEGSWKRFGGGFAFRWGGFTFPNMHGSERVYSSPTVLG